MIVNQVRRGGVALVVAATIATVLSACGTVAQPKAENSKSAPANSFCTGTGVNVVVDFGTAGGGVKKGCGHGKTAQAAIASAGFTFGMKPSSYGPFACTINGFPADKKCDGKPAYWGLFIGKGTSWSYATMGVSTQPVKDGQTVAMAWQTSAKSTMPSTQPASAK